MRKIFQEIIGNVINDIPSKHLVWLETINSQDELTALESATRGLTFAMSDKTLAVKTLCNIIDDVARKTSPILNKLSQQFIRFELMSSSVETNILTVVHNFHKQLYSGYVSQLNDFCNHPKQHKKELANRYMHAAVNQAFEMLKWRSFVNVGLAPKAWLQLHKIFEIAESNQLLNQVLLNDEQPVNKVTLSALLLQTYMLDTLLQINLSRQGIDIASKLLRSQLINIEISKEFNLGKFLFYVDLAKDNGAKRIRHLSPTETGIYWQIDSLEKSIQAIITELSVKTADSLSNYSSMAFLNTPLIVEPHQIKALAETLELLLREWSRDNYIRQRRKAIRRKISTTANVVHGIKEICLRIKSNENGHLNYGVRLSNEARLLEQRFRTHHIIKGTQNTLNIDTINHHWIIIDESNQGLGAVASRELNTRTAVGQLVGLVLANAKQEMIIAVIRSTRPKANRQMQVGIEILSHHAKWVQLRPADESETVGNKQAAYNTSLEEKSSFSGLYLPIEAGISTESMLILPRIEFIPHTYYEISIAGMLDKVTLSNSIDSKNDWVKINYPR